jgi:hypothetical protein
VSKGAQVLSTTEARQAQRAGIVRVLASSLVLAAGTGVGLVMYF